ncbi:MAG TPA: HAD-IIIC family phosphatase [Solirubrobacteraceae bacterium]|jgi:FkbH-like protein|nr:HAD-IIIC family phosphatase [Solirubrobacteraceae bacterium]
MASTELQHWPAAQVFDQRVAEALGRRIDEIVALWERLEPNGPGFGQTVAAEQELARSRYYAPLARMLVEGLSGSAAHRATYIDCRLNYLPKALSGHQRAELLSRLLQAEGHAIAEILDGDCPPEVTEEVLTRIHAPLTCAPEPGDPRLLLIGDCVFNDVRLFLSERVFAATGRAPDVDHIFFTAGPQPLEPDELRRVTGSAAPTLIGLSLFSYSGVPAYGGVVADAKRLRGHELQARVQTLATMVALSIEAIREVTDATVLVHTACSLPVTRRRASSRLLPAESRARRRLNMALTDAVAEVVAATENTLLVDEQLLIAEHGGLKAMGSPILGPDYEEAYAHPARFGSVLADHYTDALAAQALLGKAKVLLVDFDNTLWSGVMAEGDVHHFAERQRLLHQLREAGVLLVALSKNDTASIRWQEIALAPDDFVLQMINWRPKPDNVSDAILALDLAAEAFVLLDDNPVERALVEENVPGVRSLDPGDPASWRCLEQWLEMPSTTQTDEARRRTQLYREAAERRIAMGSEHDYGQMMSSLELRAELRPAGEHDMPRLLELIQRTNQFNTTTRRRSAAEVKELLVSPQHEIFVASLGDRFGDLGVVAVVITERTPDGEIELDSFIMSCRAMGFGLEQFTLAEVTRRLDAPRYTARFIPTERNGPAAGLYPANGFTETEPGLWTLDPAARPECPAWLRGEAG